MSGIGRLNNLKIDDFHRVAESDQAINLSSDGTVIAKSSFASKVAAFFKPEKARRENQQATATFVASITRTLSQGLESGIFSRLGSLSPQQKEAIVANLLNYRDASGKGILDDQLSGAKPLTGRKVAQVINLVSNRVTSDVHDSEINAIKNQIASQLTASHDIQPQLNRLVLGELNSSEDVKTIRENEATLTKSLSANLYKLKKEVASLSKQLKELGDSSKSDAISAKIAEFNGLIDSGESAIRELSVFEVIDAKSQIDEQVPAGNDLQPQLDRLRFGKLRPSEDAKTIKENVAALAKSLSANVKTLDREVSSLTAQLKRVGQGPEADSLEAKIGELGEFIKSGELTLRDLNYHLDPEHLTPEESGGKHISASSINYLSKKEPLPEGAAIQKSILHREKRIDKGDSRTYFETAKSSRVRVSENIDIGIVPNSAADEESGLRQSVDHNKSSKHNVRSEIRRALKADPKISEADIEQLLGQTLNHPGITEEALQEKIKQANLDYGIDTSKKV
jgi:F0F1-type ATP synthase membrane subunit b/b'